MHEPAKPVAEKLTSDARIESDAMFFFFVFSLSLYTDVFIGTDTHQDPESVPSRFHQDTEDCIRPIT